MKSSLPHPSLVFRQTSLHRWEGRLLNRGRCIDLERSGLPADDARFNITEHSKTGECSVLVQGSTPQSRRYVTYPNLEAAQAGGIRWARRRFRLQDDAP